MARYLHSKTTSSATSERRALSKRQLNMFLRSSTLAAAILCLFVSNASLAALIYKVDVDTSQGFGIDTQSGWSGLDATSGDGAATTVGGVTFRVFSADGSRSRSTAGANPLTRDFVFDDGDGAAVGLIISGLPNGIWEADVYAYDSDFPIGNQIIGITQFTSAPETIFTTSFVENATIPYTFRFDSTALIDGFGIFTRENSGLNRARFNALELRQVPAPSALALILLGFGISTLVRKRAP
jgi:hypothetical protein